MDEAMGTMRSCSDDDEWDATKRKGRKMEPNDEREGHRRIVVVRPSSMRGTHWTFTGTRQQSR
jgi:hypothetical protein